MIYFLTLLLFINLPCYFLWIRVRLTNIDTIPNMHNPRLLTLYDLYSHVTSHTQHSF